MIEFPHISTRRAGNKTEALAALSLRYLLRADLVSSLAEELSGRFDMDLPPMARRLQRNREEFLRAMASWSSDTTLELHHTVVPNIIHTSAGRVDISLFIRVLAKNKELAMELAAKRYLALKPLLYAWIPEAEFRPVVNQEEANVRFNPFTATHAASIVRRVETFSLDAPIKRLSLGFSSQTDHCEDPSIVDYKYPWSPSFDGWSALINTLLGQLDPIKVVVRINPGVDLSDYISRLEKMILQCEEVAKSSYQGAMKKQADILTQDAVSRLAALREKAFRLGVFILGVRPIDSSVCNSLASVITSPVGTSPKGGLFQGGHAIREILPDDAIKPDFFSDMDPYTAHEAAAAFRLCSPPMEVSGGLPIKTSRTNHAIYDMRSKDESSICLFVNEHRGSLMPIDMGLDDRMRHTFIIGQTGTGKSTLMESMILQDIRAGRGVAVLDPHGELVDDLMGKLPADRLDDIVVMDVMDKVRPIGFNLLEWKTIEERDLIIDEIYLTLDRIYDMKSTGGPIFESHFRGMLKLLMGDKPRKKFIPTLLEFIRCYVDSDFRSWLKKGVDDDQTIDFLKELEHTGGDASLRNVSVYITSKFSRYVQDTTLSRMFGQSRSTIDFKAIMEEGKVLLVKLGKGRFGPNMSALLANQIVARFKFAAMSRAELPPEKRRDFLLYVDECHNLPPENFTELLAEARKYRMGLILTTQYCSQLARAANGQDSLLSAIRGNVGTILSFRLGQEDATMMEQIFSPCFHKTDIVNLPNWHGYAKLQLYNEPTSPFSFATIKDSAPNDFDLAGHIIETSRNKYGRDLSVVDAEIKRRRNIDKSDDDDVENHIDYNLDDLDLDLDLDDDDDPPELENGKEPETDSRCHNLNLQRRLEDLNLFVRTFNCLKNAGIHRVDEVVKRTEIELLMIKNFGRKSLNEIKEVLAKMGLSLKDSYFTNSIGMKFFYIPPGTFMMGSPASEKDRVDDEGPQRQVTLTKGFWLQTTQVTQGQWKAVMGSNPSHFKDCGDNCPVEEVSWNDAQEFIRRLSQQDGKTYTLPTEAQWEYAARAGSTTAYCFGDDEERLGEYAWYEANSGEEIQPVGAKKPNAWGLYDMHGNVWEWCEDWYGKYPSDSVTDPTGPSSGSFRVFRGGSWNFSAQYCRSADRGRGDPGGRSYVMGFRVARTE